MDPKSFLEAPSAQLYANFEGGRRFEKRDFFVQHFFGQLKKGRQNFRVFLKIHPRTQENPRSTPASS